MQLESHGGIYSPLSQAIDTDESEEEIHNSSKHHRRLQQKHTQQQKKHQQHNPQQQLQEQQLNLAARRYRNPPTTLALGSSSNHHPKERQQRQRQLLMQQRQTYSDVDLGNGHCIAASQQQQQQSTAPPSSYTTNMQKTFRTVMMSSDTAHCDPNSSFNSEYDERNHIDADNVAILDNGESNLPKQPMSRLRRGCFIASLLLCAFTVVGFVWLVPCENSRSCPARIDRIKTHNWLNNYTKIELKGGVHIVSGLRSWENNLVLLYRGDKFFSEQQENTKIRNGIISFVGSSGAVAWFDEIADEPVALDCTLLDVDGNGRADCLVMDEYGALGAINPLSGEWNWHFKSRSLYKLDATDFPIMLPDLDGDGVLEILMVTGNFTQQNRKSKQRNVLRILSGRTGEPTSDGFQMHECDILRKLQLEGKQTLSFVCVRNNTEAQRSKTLAELYALITNKSIMRYKSLPAAEILQYNRRYANAPNEEGDGQRNIYSLSGRELIVENRGQCPEDCNATLILSETINGQTRVLRNFTNVYGMYGHVPAQWHFKNSKTNMSGFVMKFWKWNQIGGVDLSNATASVLSKNNAKKNAKNNSVVKDALGNNLRASHLKEPTNAPSNSKKANSKNHSRRKRHLTEFPFDSSEEFDVFAHRMPPVQSHRIQSTLKAQQQQQRQQQSNNRVARSTNYSAFYNANMLHSPYKMQMITETVILVLFDRSDTRIENTSQSNIVQFCRTERNEVICQPDLKNQENSMLIADLDQDGSQELLSYTSTFVKNTDGPSEWKLVTYVRLLRLQAELPALFKDEHKQN